MLDSRRRFVGGLWLRDLGPVDDPQPGVIGLAAQDLHPDAGVVSRSGRGQRQVLEPDGGQRSLDRHGTYQEDGGEASITTKLRYAVDSMKLLRILLGTTWIAVGIAAIVAWGFTAVATALTFLFAYGSPPGSYTGQMDDRQAAWSFLIILSVLSVIVVVVAAWPLARWRRRRASAPQNQPPSS